MEAPITINTTLKKGGRIDVVIPELKEGDWVQLTVTLLSRKNSGDTSKDAPLSGHDLVERWRAEGLVGYLELDGETTDLARDLRRRAELRGGSGD